MNELKPMGILIIFVWVGLHILVLFIILAFRKKEKRIRRDSYYND